MADEFSPAVITKESVHGQFHAMAKPVSSTCNLDGTYCYYLSKENLPGGPATGRMSEDMLELFGNLLDNACKWAVGKVLFSLSDGPGLSFSIEDDGPGAPREKLAQLSERGVRLDETVGGYGLGLSIAREIVSYYHGEMGFDNSSRLGGFRVWVRLPSRGDASDV